MYIFLLHSSVSYTSPAKRPKGRNEFITSSTQRTFIFISRSEKIKPRYLRQKCKLIKSPNFTLKMEITIFPLIRRVGKKCAVSISEYHSIFRVAHGNPHSSVWFAVLPWIPLQAPGTPHPRAQPHVLQAPGQLQ